VAAAARARTTGLEGLARHGALTVGVTIATLCVNLVTGILLARALGPVGRGEIAAVLAAVPIVGWLFSMGCREAVTYHQAKRPQDAGALLTSWLVVIVPLGIAGTALGEALLPYVLAAQDGETVRLAQLLMLSLLLFFVSELVYGVLLGDRDFLFYNAVRLGQPLVIACCYLSLWAGDALSVGSAVLVIFLASLADTFVVATRVLRRHTLARPDPRLTRMTLWYGLRAHGTATGGALTTRLDLMIIPAFLSAATVGLYSVAANVSWIVVTVSASLAPLVLPTAAAQEGGGRRTVVRSVHATLAVAVVVAAVLAVSAGFAVPLVYGSAFEGSVAPLRLLLAGSVLYAGATVLFSGLYALNRPFTAAVNQVGGILVTVVGLVIFLEDGGIWAAAIVSSVAYTTVFGCAVVTYRRAAGLTWRDLIPHEWVVSSWRRAAHALARSS
jgi:O-antigen/teichoic acid export membrane protein